ncbi:MAG: winged helix-turn-helix domain-containing protein [Archaeoglobales archaeon]|nr:winged helix-turn-helix domain-containing protein [Archaeoglobales archaeon]
MKSILEYKIEEIAKRLDEILKAVNLLQDAILQLNAVIEATSMKMNERELIYSVIAEINEKLDKFKAESSKGCNLKEICTKRMEKVSFRILQIIAKNGVEDGLKEIRKQLQAVEKYREVCKDESCMENAIEVFKALERILERSMKEREALNLRKEIIQKLDPSLLSEGLAEKLSSVSNPLRIRILKALAKGKKSYAELERITSIKGGHLQFHLRTLIRAGYVAKEEPEGKYMLTNDGLKTLKVLCQLEE